MDINHLFPFVETLYRANNNTVSVFTCETRLANNMSHEDSPLLVVTLGEKRYIVSDELIYTTMTKIGVLNLIFHQFDQIKGNLIKKLYFRPQL